MTKASKQMKIRIDGKEVTIAVSRATFFDVQSMSRIFLSGEPDLEDYWREAFTRWVTASPSIDFNELSAEDGAAIADLLPSPSEVVTWLNFRQARSDE